MSSNNFQKIFFVAGIIIFILIACFGWVKLHYGFNFIDEGYHMTESWRLSQGDNLLDNKEIGPLMPYTLLNSLIFSINPDITLLDFRKIQYILALCSILIFSCGLYAATKTYWYIPYIFSVFAFTGLDPTGMIANLNYYTYPHFFLTLYLSFFIFGLYYKQSRIRNICFILSGFFMWAVSFSLLYLVPVVLSPILLYFACRMLPVRSLSFSFIDLLLILMPFIACWLLYIGIFEQSFIPAIFDSVSYVLVTKGYSKDSLLSSLAGTAGYIGIGAIIFLMYYFFSKQLKGAFLLIAVGGVAILTYFIIESSLFGLIKPYYNGWFGRPMWFSALIIAFLLFFWGHMAQKAFRKIRYTQIEEFAFVLLIPVTIKSICTVFFSGLKALTVLHSAIPATAALGILLIHNMDDRNKSLLIKLTVLLLVLAPFYCTTAWADWKFTYFDVTPQQTDATISQGFGKGLRTNKLYTELYHWVGRAANKYSDKDDFMLSYVVSPMNYMIAKRRPALNDTFTDFSSRKTNVYEKSIELMKEKKRYPAIAFVFQRMPAMWPVSLKEGTFKTPGKQFIFKWSEDPISNYIKNHMVLAEQFYISRENDHVVRCFVDPQFGNIK